MGAVLKPAAVPTHSLKETEGRYPISQRASRSYRRTQTPVRTAMGTASQHQEQEDLQTFTIL